MFGDIGSNLRNFKAYRQTYRAPRYAMKVPDLDGYLTALAFMQAVSEDPTKWQPVIDHALDSMLTISDKCVDVDGKNLSGGNFDPACTALFGYQFFEFTEHLKVIHAVMREHREPTKPKYNFGFDRNSTTPSRKWSFTKTIKNAFIGSSMGDQPSA